MRAAIIPPWQRRTPKTEIPRGCTRAFVPIAEGTGVGQIAYTRGAAVFAADDVIDLMRKARAILIDQTVFATSMRTLDRETARGVVYITSHWSGSAGRALWPSGGYVPDPCSDPVPPSPRLTNRPLSPAQSIRQRAVGLLRRGGNRRRLRSEARRVGKECR